MRHPLLNPQSTHYSPAGVASAIELYEKQATVQEGIGFCKGNLFKYSYRLEKKNQRQDDLAKIETYENYLRLLMMLPSHAPNASIFDALTAFGIEVEYEIL